MISFNLNYLLTSLSPNTFTLGVIVSKHEFWGDTIQSITVNQRPYFFFHYGNLGSDSPNTKMQFGWMTKDIWQICRCPTLKPMSPFYYFGLFYSAEKLNLCFNDLCSSFRYRIFSKYISISLTTTVPNLLLHRSKLNLQYNCF